MCEPGDLRVSAELNLAEHACHLHRHLEGARVIETGDLVIADSGLRPPPGWIRGFIRSGRMDPRIHRRRLAGDQHEGLRPCSDELAACDA